MKEKYYYYPFEFSREIKNGSIKQGMFYIAQNGCIYKLNINIFNKIVSMELPNFNNLVTNDKYNIMIYFNFKSKLRKSLFRTLKVLKLSGVLDLEDIPDKKLADYFKFRLENGNILQVSI